MAGNSSIVTPEKIRNLQRTLYRQAKGNLRWKAWSLYGDLCRHDLLEFALKQVIANRGAPGIDGMKVETLKADAELRGRFLDELLKLLKEKSYKPDPVRRVYIPKANGKQRPLGIPTVKDRVVQTAMKMLLEPIFEADFHPYSFAYRPEKRAQQAIGMIEKGLLRGRTEVVDADLSKYFDTIPHSALLKQIKKRVSDGSILKVIKAWLRAPVVEENSGTGKKRNLPNKRGTPQGGVISPLLANLYLNDLDYAVNEKCGLNPIMIRYADDLVILCRKGEGPGLKKRLSRYLKTKGLELNEAKTQVINSLEEGFTFVGFRINWRRSWKTGKDYPHTEPSRSSQRKLRDKVREVLNRWTIHREVEDAVKDVNRISRGWGEYFHYGNSTRVFSYMQEWTEDRLKRWLWKKHARKNALWKGFERTRFREQYRLYRLPMKIKY